MLPMGMFHHQSNSKHSSNPHFGHPGFNKFLSNTDKKNDYCQHFVNTGERPQNFIRDIRPEQRFAG